MTDDGARGASFQTPGGGDGDGGGHFQTILPLPTRTTSSSMAIGGGGGNGQGDSGKGGGTEGIGGGAAGEGGLINMADGRVPGCGRLCGTGVAGNERRSASLPLSGSKDSQSVTRPPVSADSGLTDHQNPPMRLSFMNATSADCSTESSPVQRPPNSPMTIGATWSRAMRAHNVSQIAGMLDGNPACTNCFCGAVVGPSTKVIMICTVLNGRFEVNKAQCCGGSRVAPRMRTSMR